MKKMFLALAGLFLIAADAPRNDKESFQGTWIVVQGTKNGEPLPAELLKGLRITFAGDKIILKSAGSKNEGTFALDSKKKPPEITITYSDGKTMPSKGIYTFGNDKLFLCVADPGMERATSFKPAKGAKWQVLVLSKGKAEN
jgi:uncharacterized protein (TIGR03067 family)